VSSACPPSARLWPDIIVRSDKEGWPAACLLAALAELELADRARRRIERHLAETRLAPGKTLATFDFTAVPTLSKAHVALAAGTSWLERGANLLMFGPPGSGKSHASTGLAGHRQARPLRPADPR
jgi:DNA replication protein DnaC